MTRNDKNSRPTKVGSFIKHSSDKTISVLTESRVMHPRYKKIIKKSKKYLVHYESDQDLEKGDKVMPPKTPRANNPVMPCLILNE